MPKHQGSSLLSLTGLLYVAAAVVDAGVGGIVVDGVACA